MTVCNVKEVAHSDKSQRIITCSGCFLASFSCFWSTIPDAVVCFGDFSKKKKKALTNPLYTTYQALNDRL